MNLAYKEKSRAARCKRVRRVSPAEGQQQLCYLRGWNLDDEDDDDGKVKGERHRGIIVI